MVSHFVGRTSVEEQDGTVIKRADGLAQRPTRFFNMWDENFSQPIPKNITNNEAVLGGEEADFLLVISAFKNTRTDCPGLRDDGRGERCPVQGDAYDESVSIRCSGDSEVDVCAPWCDPGKESEDPLPVRISFSPHLALL